MSPTGLVFAALAAFWLIYLVPLFLHRDDSGLMEEAEPGEPFTASVTIVRRGTPLDSAENGTAIVSTPLNRRAALRELSDLDRGAARRRRTVLLVLGLLATVMAVLAALSLVPWWTPAPPVGLAVVFLVVARFSVRSMRRKLDARAQVVRGGDCVDERTVPIASLDEHSDVHGQAVELSAPVKSTGSLWDPIPITAATYVSRPLAPRTVRTIDLSAPVPTHRVIPVTADPPEGHETAPEASEAEGERKRAVGE